MRKRLIVTIAAPVLLAALLSAVLLYFMDMRSTTRKIESDALEHTNVTLTHLQNILNSQLSSGNMEDARLSLSVSAMHTGVHTLLLSDENDRILLANRYIWEGEAATILDTYDPSLAKQVRLTHAPLVKFSERRDRLYGYYPVTIKIAEKELGLRKLGVLFFEYDITGNLAKAQSEAANYSLLFGLLSVLMAILVSLLLRRLVTTRIGRLVLVTQKFAEGNSDVRANMHGSDEVALLGQAFDVMAEQREKVDQALAQDIVERKRAQLELQRNQDLLNEAQRLGHLGSWELDLVSGDLRWSDEVYKIFEVSPQQFSLNYESFLKLVHPDDRDKVDQAYTRTLQDHQNYDILHRLLMPDGRIKWVREKCSSDFDASGKPLRSVGAVQDVTEQKLAEDSLRVAAVTFDMHEAIMITDANARIIRVNQAFQDVTGYGQEEILGKNPRILSSGRQDMAFYAEFWQHLLSTGSWSGEMWDKRKNGQVYPKWLTITAVKDAQGEVSEYVAIFSDITSRKQAEEEIRNLAFYDSLTQLPNRRLLLDRFRSALSVSARSDNYGAVLFLDLDRFKVLNDTLGHDHGDLLLIDVAKRIQSCVREMDTVARLGGDEFVVLIEEVDADAEEASQRVALIAEKIRAALAEPFMINDHECHSSPSIGVCLYRGSLESVDTLLKHADMAMYQAKDSGRNTVRFFDPFMQQAVEDRAALEADLRGALARQQLSLFYQIQVDNELRPLGAEALIRWKHPQRGMVSPAKFIPVAEESSLILEIGNWVLDTACQQLALWSEDLKTRHLIIAVNVSAQQFMKHDFVETVATVLRSHHVEPSRLKLELTESMVLVDVSDVVKKMHALKALGVGLSMDDFGTGYSSLSYLKQLPLDQIKIDQSFVRDVINDPNDAVLVQTIIDMAKNFRLNVIAEGIETQEQLSFLKQHGCMAYQGYLFSKPVPIEQLDSLLGEYL